MKILIACDMEGITGVVNWDQVTPGHDEYTRFRKIMTQDVNAAVKGAYDGGATEVIVADGHWNGTNILVEELDARARLNASTSSPYSRIALASPSPNSLQEGKSLNPRQTGTMETSGRQYWRNGTCTSRECS